MKRFHAGTPAALPGEASALEQDDSGRNYTPRFWSSLLTLAAVRWPIRCHVVSIVGSDAAAIHHDNVAWAVPTATSRAIAPLRTSIDIARVMLALESRYEDGQSDEMPVGIHNRFTKDPSRARKPENYGVKG